MRVVGTALDADTALQQALALEPSIVLLELQLPCGTGIATIEHLHAALPDVAVIVLSLLDADAYREAALAAGADDFVSKTQLSTQLLPAIRRGLAAASERRRSVA